jgi:RNase P subunit RPR2
MTPKQVIDVNFSEISKVEITCDKCGAALAFPIPQENGQNYPPNSYACLACNAVLWNGVHDERYLRVYNLFDSLAHWRALRSQGFSLSFSLTSD